MAKYDPNAKYGWDKATIFSLNGNEFGLILNTFRTVLATPEAQKILLLSQANNTMESVLQRNVESGAIQEAPIEESPAAQMKVVAPEDKKPVTKKAPRKKVTK